MYRKASWKIGAAGIAMLFTVSVWLIPDASIAASHVQKASKSMNKTDVLGLTIAGDSPASLLYYPIRPADVTLKVSTWLRHATSVTIHMPKSHVGVINAYVGPARMSFIDEQGNPITVYPAFYMSELHQHQNGGPITTRFPYPGVLAYQDGSHTMYLKSIPLYNWLKEDTWKSAFLMESYTPTEQNAVHAVASSQTWRWLFHDLFPTAPMPAVREIIPSGMTINGLSTLPVTCSTYLSQDGNDVRVSLSEVWNNGGQQHNWTFMVNLQGEIVSHTDSGNTPPQSQK